MINISKITLSEVVIDSTTYAQHQQAISKIWDRVPFKHRQYVDYRKDIGSCVVFQMGATVDDSVVQPYIQKTLEAIESTCKICHLEAVEHIHTGMCSLCHEEA